MVDREDGTSLEPERPRASTRHLVGATPAAKKVAGARRNPSVVGVEETVPRWLRTTAGWSWRMLVVVVAIALVFWATSRILLVFIAVFVALVLTAVLRPVVNVLQRVMPRTLATALSVVGFYLLVIGLLAWVGFQVAGQWESLGEQFNEGIGDILQTLEDSPLHITVTNADVQGWIEDGQRWVSENSGAIASQAWSGVGSVGQVFAVIAIATFCTVFFVSRGTEMWEWFLNQLPLRYRESWYLGGGAVWYTFSGYTRGTFIVAAADGALAAIVLLVLRVPLAAPLAVLVFIGAFIPLIGAPAAMVVAMIVALATQGPIIAVVVGIAIALIGQFEQHVLTPVVMGKQVSLHPVVVALGVAAGTLVAGILGAVIAVPLLAVAWAVFALLRQVDPPTDFSELDEEEVRDEVVEEITDQR